MRLYPSLSLAAALAFVGANSLQAVSVSGPQAMPVSGPVEDLAQKLRDDPKAREAAFARVALFVQRDDGGVLTFVVTLDTGAVLAVSNAWAQKLENRQLAEFYVVTAPKSKLEGRLVLSLAKWTGSGRIKQSGAASATTAFLNDALAKAAQILADQKTRQEIDAAIQANDAIAVPVPGTRESIERARKMQERGAGKTDVFGVDRTAQDLAPGLGASPARLAPPAGAPPAAAAVGQPGLKTPQEIADLATELNAAERARREASRLPPLTTKVSDPVEFQSLGSVEVAPAAGVLDRASSLAARDAPVIAADLAQISASLKDAELPTATAINEGNPGAIQEFFKWLRTAKEADMPSIDYAIMPKGEVGSYSLGLLSKGDITLNHFIRSEPARVRASVLVHELYHYWDKKVARNYYANVSYGQIDPATKHTHEYDAYLATSLYWQMVKQEGDASPLARLLDRIPTDPGQVRELVNKAVGGP